MAKKKKDEQFDEPEEELENVSSEEEAESDYDAPPEEEGAEDASASEAQSMGDVDGQILDIYSQACDGLEEQTAQIARSAKASAEDAFEGAGNIQGFGLGMGDESDFLSGPPGQSCLTVYVAEPCAPEEARSILADSMGISAAADDEMPLNVVVTGVIDAQPHRFRIRPAPGGVSVGHFRITAGTLGCLARGRRRPRNRRILILSNNHVLANSNNAAFGDSIIQPGRVDGGVSPRDRIAILERFVPINFAGGANFVDCATGWAWPRRVRRELIYLSGGRRRFFRISSAIRPCRRNLIVGKSGRTTQLTAGRVTDCNATIRVNYGAGRVALFRDQIAIRGLRGNFSRGGDSGSVIWTWDRRRNPIGLLFAGGGGVTFANKMRRVVSALDINLFT